MKTSFSLAIVALMVMVSGVVFAETPEKDYFDKQFIQLNKLVAEVKGDTTQIVSILGNVFEGTVPKGGNLIKLCNENGWSLVVLMGHNEIINPNIVAVGTCFSYPQTIEEFKQALSKGKPLYDAWLKKQQTTFRVNQIKADTVEIDELNIRIATFKEELMIKDMQIDQLRIRLAEITEKLSVKKAEIGELNVKVANLDQVNIGKLNVKDAEIKNLRIQNLEIKNAFIEKMRINNLEVQRLQCLLDTANECIKKFDAKPIVISYNSIVCISNSCDERSYTGNVGKAVLKRCPNGADAIEVLKRYNKKERFKAKRVRIEINGQANPLAWSDGVCIRTYSEDLLTQAELQGLLHENETLVKIEEYQDGIGGNHNTIAVYLILPYQ